MNKAQVNIQLIKQALAVGNLPEEEFRQVMKNLHASKYKGFKSLGTVAGALGGSGVGSLVGAKQTYDKQRAGELDDLDTKQKIKIYLKNMAKPGLIGAGIGGAIGLGGGALAKNKVVEKQTKITDNLLNKLPQALGERFGKVRNKLVERERGMFQAAAQRDFPDLQGEELAYTMHHPKMTSVIEQSARQTHPRALTPPSHDQLQRLAKERIYKKYQKIPETNLWNTSKQASAEANIQALISGKPVVGMHAQPTLMKATDKRKKDYSVQTSTPGLKLAKYL